MPRKKKIPEVALHDLPPFEDNNLSTLTLSDLNVLHGLITDSIASYNHHLGQAAYLDPDSAMSMIDPIQRTTLTKRNRYESFHVKVRREIERRIDNFIKADKDVKDKG